MKEAIPPVPDFHPGTSASCSNFHRTAQHLRKPPNNIQPQTGMCPFAGTCFISAIKFFHGFFHILQGKSFSRIFNKIKNTFLICLCPYFNPSSQGVYAMLLDTTLSRILSSFFLSVSIRAGKVSEKESCMEICFSLARIFIVFLFFPEELPQVHLILVYVNVGRGNLRSILHLFHQRNTLFYVFFQ